MARVTCRCGETLKVRASDPDRIVCPRCGAKIRVRRSPAPLQGMSETADGYLRFHCPCGRRLKVRALGWPEAGKCPDCGRIVPVPASAWPGQWPASPAAGDRSGGGNPEARTQEMDAQDLARLERWAARYRGASNPEDPAQGEATTTSHHALEVSPAAGTSSGVPPSAVKMEAGLRICLRCGKPLRMSAIVCRECGESVAKR